MYFRFAHPDILNWLWLLPLALFLLRIWAGRRRKRFERVYGKKSTFLTSSISKAKRRWKLVFWSASLIFCVMALARPQMGQSQQQVKSEGIELIVALDVSTSMLAEDVKPSRLEYAKAEISRLLDMLGGDRVGLVAFAGSAALISPLTSDKSALKMFLDSLSIESVQTQGTDFFAALREAEDAFDRGGVQDEENVRVTRVILLASDGEDHEARAADEVKRLRKDGYRVFALAFGTEKGAPIPIRDERGYLAGYKRDRQGQNVVSATRGTFLRELAQLGEGSFYHTSFGGNDARLIKEDLDKLERTQFDSELISNYDEKYQVFLVPAILFAFFALLLNERRNHVPSWNGRFEVRS